MYRFKTAAALVTLLSLPAVAHALPGPAPFEKAIAEYDFSTGQIVVSYNGVWSWSVHSESLGLTGDVPIGIPSFGGLISDSDYLIGETGFGPHTGTDINLGNVAAPELPLGDLKVGWHCGLGDGCGQPVEPRGSVVYINVPEPSSLLLASLGLLAIGYRCRSRRQGPIFS